MSKLLTIFGATGKQGGSVIAYVQAHPELSKEFKIRGISRDASKPSSQALAKKGVEVVTANMDDPASLHKALEGSYAVYAMTDYWDIRSKDLEIKQGKNIAEATKAVGVQHLIWSTLPNVTEVSNGSLRNVYHFDGKAEIEDYIKSLGIPYTCFVPGYYMENFKKSEFSKGEDGTYTLTYPIPSQTPFPLIAATDDTGLFVATALHKRDDLLGKSIYGSSGYYTLDQICEIFTKVTGYKAKYVETPAETWKTFLPEWMALEMLENYYLLRDYMYYGGDDPEGHLKWSLDMTSELGRPTTLEKFFETHGPW